mgnify:CR=1 FL=1
MVTPDITRYTRHIPGRPNQRRGHGAVQAPSPFAPQHAAQTIACRWNVVLALERSNFRVWKQQEGHYLDKNASQILDVASISINICNANKVIQVKITVAIFKTLANTESITQYTNR